MTIDEISRTLPNGFHDSDILSINIDYVEATATFLIRVDLCSPDEEVEITSRSGVMKLTGLLYCVIEPTTLSLTNPVVHPVREMWISADSSDFSELNEPPKLPSPLPEKSFRHWFFDSNGNLFIYVAAMDASFCWVGDK